MSTGSKYISIILALMLCVGTAAAQKEGGISTQITLPYGTPEEVENETRKVTEYMSRNGGYIISGSHTVQADVPFENLCKLIDVANSIR